MFIFFIFQSVIWWGRRTPESQLSQSFPSSRTGSEREEGEYYNSPWLPSSPLDREKGWVSVETSVEKNPSSFNQKAVVTLVINDGFSWMIINCGFFVRLGLSVFSFINLKCLHKKTGKGGAEFFQWFLTAFR